MSTSGSGVHATAQEAAVRAGADYLVHSVFNEPIDDELVQMILAHHVLVCPTLFVTTGYSLALSNQWQATPDEQRLADPRILATMRPESVRGSDARPASPSVVTTPAVTLRIVLLLPSVT